jgi:hypothetical protein
MLLTNLLISGFDYNSVERERVINSNFLTSNLVEEVVYYKENESSFERQNTYLFDFNSISSVYQTISLKLKEEFEKNNISSDVYKTSYDLISLLPESILFKLKEDDLYPTNYGTLVLDWEDEKSNDEFSLEVGNNCFGYFSEFDGKDTINVEEVAFSTEEVNELHKKIEEFYQR